MKLLKLKKRMKSKMFTIFYKFKESEISRWDCVSYSFNSYEECIKHIKLNFKKIFNKKYQGLIFKIIEIDIDASKEVKIEDL